MIQTVKPMGKYRKTLECMPDKSMSIRAVILGAYSKGVSRIDNVLMSDDVRSAVSCVKKLGAKVESRGKTLYITGRPFAGCELYCGNSGTTARLLIGLLSGLNGVFTLTGDESLSSRPMRRVIDPLRSMGANIIDTDGHLPITVVGSALSGIDYRMPIASAQVKSALLLAGLNAAAPVTVREKVRSRDHTENMLEASGVTTERRGNVVKVYPSIVKAFDFTVPGDISSAAYPICLALMTGGECTVKNVGVNETRTGIIDVLKASGADIEYKNVRAAIEPVADIVVKKSKLAPISVGGEIIPRLVDEIPALCALACFIDGTSVIKDAGELKVKETNRIVSTVEALRALGADIEATDDGMIIRGGKPLKFAAVDPKLDHRIAMSAAIAGAAASGVEIIDAECAAVSYPNFYEEVIGV